MNTSGSDRPPFVRGHRVALSVCAFCALAGAAAWWWAPSALLVEEVRFEGNSRVADAALRHLVDIPNGSGWLDVDLKTSAAKLAAHPWVASAYGRWTWRGVAFTVEERRVVALAEHGGSLVYVDRTGEAFLAARSDDLDYPRIAGLGSDVAGMHPDLAPIVRRDAVALLDALDTAGLVGIDAVSEVLFAPTRGFTVHTRAGAELLFGLSSHPEQIERLGALAVRGVDLSHPVYVDLAPERVAIVRPLTADATDPAVPGGA